MGGTATKDAPPPLFIPLYSTVRPFAAYMASCDDLAKGLKALGLFDHFFVKWPLFELLQRAVLEAKLRPLLPELPPEAQSVPAKQSLRRSAVDENELHHEQPPLSPSC